LTCELAIDFGNLKLALEWNTCWLFCLVLPLAYVEHLNVNKFLKVKQCIVLRWFITYYQFVYNGSIFSSLSLSSLLFFRCFRIIW